MSRASLAVLIGAVFAGGAAAVAWSQTAPPPSSPTMSMAGAPAGPATAPSFVPGYLAPEVVRSLGAVPPPPTEDAADRAFQARVRALQGAPRWTLAQADAPLDAGAAGRVFACALGRPLPPEAAAVLEKVKTDAGLATDPSKRL